MQNGAAFEVLIETCLVDLSIETMSEWDTLVFFYRHGISLVSAEYASRLLGYSPILVSNALEKLALYEIVRQSEPSENVRLYRFAGLDTPFSQRISEILATPHDRSAARIVVARKVRDRHSVPRSRPRNGIHFA